MQLVYLHGFASSPQSQKAEYFRQACQQHGLEIVTPDLNLHDFTRLEISVIYSYLQELIKPYPEVTLIGSSMGGLLSLALAQSLPKVAKVVLLAPALKLAQLLPSMIGSQMMSQWQREGFLSVFHSGYRQEKQLGYQFYTDLVAFSEREFTRQIPSLIFHGTADATIPIQVSYDYLAHNPHAKLYPLASDHSLVDQLPFIWQQTYQFLIDADNKED
jgi:hypothetical protein